MDILVKIEEIIIDDSCIFVASPEDVTFDESVGIGDTFEEAIKDAAESLNTMLYLHEEMPLLFDAGHNE